MLEENGKTFRTSMSSFFDQLGLMIFDADLDFEERKSRYQNYFGLATKAQLEHAGLLLEQVQIGDLEERNYRYRLIDCSFEQVNTIIDELQERFDYEQSINCPKKRFLFYCNLSKAA